MIIIHFAIPRWSFVYVYVGEYSLNSRAKLLEDVNNKEFDLIFTIYLFLTLNYTD